MSTDGDIPVQGVTLRNEEAAADGGISSPPKKAKKVTPGKVKPRKQKPPPEASASASTSAATTAPGGGSAAPDAPQRQATDRGPDAHRGTASTFNDLIFKGYVSEEKGRYRFVPPESALVVRSLTQRFVDSGPFHAKFSDTIRSISMSYMRGEPVLNRDPGAYGSASRLARDRHRSPFEPILYTATHDHELLQTPHLIKTQSGLYVRTPECSYGVNCIARSGVFGFQPPGSPPGGFTLRADMTPAELAEFERSGRAPAEPRPCILCSRTATLSSYTHNVITGARNPSVCIQAHYSPVDVDNGYDRRFCIFPTERATYGLVAPVVYFDLSLIRTVRKQLGFSVPGEAEAYFYYQLEVMYKYSIADAERPRASRLHAADPGAADTPAAAPARRFSPADGAELPATLAEAARSFCVGGSTGGGPSVRL